jgi:sugar lactone lactonase YvrE
MRKVNMWLLIGVLASIAAIMPSPAASGDEPVSGTIETIAGGSVGDGGAARSAILRNPLGVVVDGSGNLFIADTRNHRIRKVAPDGTISTVAGTGTAGFSGDGGVATSARLNMPKSVEADGAGNLYIADSSNHRIRRVSGDGKITTIAGTGSADFSGDGGAATLAKLYTPRGIAVDESGNLFFADFDNARIRKVATDGTISTVAGTGTLGFSGDGGPATSAELHWPIGVAVDGAGDLFFTDTYNNRVRKVTVSGTITTVAGTGGGAFSGDGGPATSAELYWPVGVAVDAAGNLFIADSGHQCVRMVATNGTITTMAGGGLAGYIGDGGAATLASLSWPYGMAVDGAGNLLITERESNRIRRVWGVAAKAGATITGAASVSHEADDAGGATVPLLLEIAGTVPSGAELVVRDVTGGRSERELYRHSARPTAEVRMGGSRLRAWAFLTTVAIALAAWASSLPHSPAARFPPPRPAAGPAGRAPPADRGGEPGRVEDRGAPPEVVGVTESRLSALIAGPGSADRGVALAEILARGDPSLARLLSPSVAADDPATRREAIRALAALGGPGARLLLARAAGNPRAGPDEQDEIRRALADTRRARRGIGDRAGTAGYPARSDPR